ncbi:hypothetical protein EW146_g1703 [Bondarzewia mesenterica]|uniref:CSN8/PSMD8/EIF3K domain-containing protein n=1 Tax=Bondarzewia mesenterica TaxID=1095465 RepID=A0A4S4M2V6_9AGAM|nr:hypothetical protein EW146_g1703 [Bondarzewia mesenterica]
MQAPPTPPLAPGDLPSETQPASVVASASTPPAPAPAPQTVNPPLPPTENPYANVLPQLVTFAATGEYNEIGLIAPPQPVDDDDPRRLFIKAPLLLSYLILDDLPPAKFVLSRVSSSITYLPFSQALFNLVASVWDRKYENVYPRAEALFNLVQQPDFPDADLASLMTALITQFVESFRRRTFKLLSKAYTSLPLALAQTYLGFGREELLIATEAYRWTYDASTQILTPARTEGPRPIGSVSEPSTLVTFNLVTDSVSLLGA